MNDHPGAESSRDVLILDREEAMRAALRGLFEVHLAGARVLQAREPHTALALCAAHEPVVVLVDAMLPGFEGIDLIRRIRELVPAAAIVVTSLHDVEWIATKAVAAGATAFIAKDKLFAELPPLLAMLDDVSPRH